MALLQALFSVLSKSVGKIVNAMFGWAVVALFGRTSSKEQTILSGVVGAAAAWPLLLVGVAFPRIAALLLAFVPISRTVPGWIIRLVWLALALTVPLVVGGVVAAKAPQGTPPEPALKRFLRGFPITLGIAASFLLMFITVPALRIASIVKGRKDEHVPCITQGAAYEIVAARIDRVLERHHLDATRAEPSWWLSGPSTVLQKLGGKALRGFMPDRLAYWKGPTLEVALYPSDILIRGGDHQRAWTHGVMAEELAHTPALQTFDSDAQQLELQIRRIWSVYDLNPVAHTKSRVLLSRLNEIAKELAQLEVDYEEWQVLYRQTVQLGRALDGEPQLLASLAVDARHKAA